MSRGGVAEATAPEEAARSCLERQSHHASYHFQPRRAPGHGAHAGALRLHHPDHLWRGQRLGGGRLERRQLDGDVVSEHGHRGRDRSDRQRAEHQRAERRHDRPWRFMYPGAAAHRATRFLLLHRDRVGGYRTASYLSGRYLRTLRPASRGRVHLSRVLLQARRSSVLRVHVPGARPGLRWEPRKRMLSGSLAESLTREGPLSGGSVETRPIDATEVHSLLCRASRPLDYAVPRGHHHPRNLHVGPAIPGRP